MKKGEGVFALCLGVCLLGGCEQGYSVMVHDHEETVEAVCESRGGILRSDRCYCGGFKCDENVVCAQSGDGCDGVAASGACVAGESRCSNGMVQTCSDNGVWGVSSACASRSCTDARVCADACVDSHCADGVYRLCVDGAVSEMSRCVFGCSEDGSTCAAVGCAEGTSRCMQDYTETCIDGIWRKGETCPSGCDTVSGECAPECDGSVYLCEELENGTGVMYACRSGFWDRSRVQSVCAIGCDKVTGDCASECTDGERRCTNAPDGTGTLEICRDGVWQDSPCTLNGNHVSCGGADSCGECLNGSPTTCEDDRYGAGRESVCLNGKIESRMCDKGVSCGSNGVCGNCHNGMVECLDGTDANMGAPLWGQAGMFVCTAGEYVLQDQAGCMGNSCLMYDEMSISMQCGECWNGFYRCTEFGESDVHIIEKCEGGQFVQIEACDNKSCHFGMKSVPVCGVCRNNTRVCKNSSTTGESVIYSCIDGMYEMTETCSNGCSPSGNYCN